ncbi:winged helix-turn-helix transcriptional regulator [Paenibacillus aquistagni]|uniref:winged helix-turn-helix transcriptional regulator n=1 Tax=Paenibacillus aquistagni TaxID=1852522 RepID=UPI00145B3A94|nr:winged helix-turn-helix transcriptional regulator [Paenibacillus aquistagni]NMM52929.1 winged helix-turn-helix transcriptional regulator [Paenibacillus aquistagni]
MAVSLEKQIQNTNYLVESYAQVINLLLEHKDNEGISRISQSEIARKLGVSQSAIAKRFSNLIKFGAIKKSGYKNAYTVIYVDLFNFSPLGLLFKLIILLDKNPEIINDYYKQAELLNVSYHDIQIARGYLSFVVT